MQQPLADRMRPKNFDEVAGQAHLIGKNGILRRLVENNRIPNMIFYGPPGTGKTTIANIIASMSGMQLFKLNATTASLSDVKEVLSNTSNMFSGAGTLLYLDEIQSFNKKQQQSLLEYMEDGRVTLICSTTENPYFAIYPALLSRSSVFEFKSVSAEDMMSVMKRAMNELCDEYGVQKTATDEILLKIARSCGGDVRKAIGALENVFLASDSELSEELADELSARSALRFDRDGDGHYDLLSAFQKSIRGSDPDAAVFYLARLLEGGDLVSACRRLMIIACEDVGLAYPQAIPIVKACVDIAVSVGLPEASLPLSDAVILLATAPKSNSGHDAYAAAVEAIRKGRGAEIPHYLRDQTRPGSEGGYKYPHIYPNHYVEQRYLPKDIREGEIYRFGDNKTERAAYEYYKMIREKKQ